MRRCLRHIAGRQRSALRDPSWPKTPARHWRATGFGLLSVRDSEEGHSGDWPASCGMCHTRVMPDGSILKGHRQPPIRPRHGLGFEAAKRLHGPCEQLSRRRFERLLYAAPWIKPDAYPGLDELSASGIAARHAAIPPGVLARHGTSPLVPAKVPDLIGIQERRYLDATGLVRHRDIGDLMRYAAQNQDTDLMARYRDFVPREAVPFFSGRRGRPANVDRDGSAMSSSGSLHLFTRAPPIPMRSIRPPNRSEGVRARERASCTRRSTPTTG